MTVQEECRLEGVRALAFQQVSESCAPEVGCGNSTRSSNAGVKPVQTHLVAVLRRTDVLELCHLLLWVFE